MLVVDRTMRIVDTDSRSSYRTYSYLSYGALGVALHFENWVVEILRLPAAFAAASCTFDVHIGHALAQ